MHYAVNACDLAVLKDHWPLHMLISPVINRDIEHVECEPQKIAGMGFILDCDQERAEAIIEVVRMQYPRHALRFYQSTTGKGSWRRV